jgi:hypothetical protein
VKVYCASKSKWAPWFRALRCAGVPISSTWIDAQLNVPGTDPPSEDTWADHWEKCIDQSRDCDVCLFVSHDGEQACGQLIEAGAALAAGKRVFVVSPYEWTFAHHPRCRIFPSLEAAIQAIMAGAAAE